MKKLLLLLAIIPLAFAACSDEKNGAEKEPGDDPWHCEDCDYERTDIISYSIGSFFRSSATMVINHSDLHAGKADIVITPVNDNTVNFTFYFTTSMPLIYNITTNDPIMVTGIPYDVNFEHLSRALIYCRDGELMEANVKIKGWMKEITTQTYSRSFPGPDFNGEIIIETTDSPYDIIYTISGIFS